MSAFRNFPRTVTLRADDKGSLRFYENNGTVIPLNKNGYARWHGAAKALRRFYNIQAELQSDTWTLCEVANPNVEIAPCDEAFSGRMVDHEIAMEKMKAPTMVKQPEQQAQARAALSEDDTTAVAFRVFPEGDVIALFPNNDEGNGLIGSFQHIGQHSGASPDLLTELRRATDAESADLRRELDSAPYNYRFTFEPGPAPSDAPRSAAAIEAALPDALVSAYRHWRGMTRSPRIWARPNPNDASDALKCARRDVASGTPRYASSDSRNVFAPLQPVMADHPLPYSASPTRERWMERPADVGLRFVGWADELNRSIRHTGWHTDEDGGNGANMRGCVYQLPARNSRAQYVPAYGDPNNTPADCGGAAYVDFTNVHRADKMDYRDDDTVRDCAYMADNLAERHAEKEREYQEAFNAASMFAETVETYRGAFDRFRPLMRQARADHDRETVRHILGSLRTIRDVTRDKLATISGNFSRAAGFLDNLGDCEKRVLSRL